MSGTSNVFSAMPVKPTNGNGLYTVEETSGPYSTTLTADDAVGTTRYPYLRSCEPAYIPTLYKNVGTINGVIGSSSLHANHSTITGVIGSSTLKYGTTTPTITGLIGNSALATTDTTITGLIGSIAITGGTITQAIATLQSASSGCSTEFLGSSSIGAITAINGYTVSVVLHTTIISSIDPSSVRASYSYTNADAATGDSKIAIYDMGTYLQASVGCSKTVMFTAAGWVNETDSTGVRQIDLGQLAFLYAGDNNYFLQNGQKTQFYQFSYIGDFVTFQMLPGTSTGWLFVVTNFNTKLTTTINVTPTNTSTATGTLLGLINSA